MNVPVNTISLAYQSKVPQSVAPRLWAVNTVSFYIIRVVTLTV